MNSQTVDAKAGFVAPELAETLCEILDASIEITQADYGNIQMLTPQGEALYLVVQSGFPDDFLQHFAIVPLRDDTSVCGRAAHRLQRHKVSDVETDADFDVHRCIARSVPYRAVQSTPLLSRSGELLGVLSTHYREPGLPDDAHFHLLDLYAAQAAHVLELMKARTLQPQALSAPAEAMTASAPLSIGLLKDLPFFADLLAEERDELARVARLRHYRTGDIVFRAGDPMTHYYWVCVGAVQKSRLTPDGRELTGAIRIAGDILLEHDASGPTRVRTMTATAIGATTLLAVPTAWIEQRLMSWDHLSNKVLELLTRRVQEARVEIEHQATFNAAQIADCFLQQLCVSHHLDPTGFTLPYPKHLIASRLGMEQESLSRVFPRLRAHGIAIDGRKGVFTDLQAAQDLACGACTIAVECRVRQRMQTLMRPADSAKEA